MITRLCKLCFMLLLPVPIAASEPSHVTARQWLTTSDEIRSTLPAPSGVDRQYEAVQLGLVQSLTWAALGEVDETVQRLPYRDNNDDWTSGGDGMVRQLLTGDTLGDVHATLFQRLRDQPDEALRYLHQLTPEQTTPDAYFQLGRQVTGIQPQKINDAAQLALFQAGQITRELEHGNNAVAGKLFKRMDKSTRERTLTQVGQLLILEGDWSTAMALYRLQGNQPEAAISMAVRAGELDHARELLELLSPDLRARYSAQLAMGFVQNGELDKARQLFSATADKQDRSWETVALMIGADDWLVPYYSNLKDPWRRSERFYQMARRQLNNGRDREALQSAQLSLDSAERIPPSSTQALAYQQLARFFAQAGKPEAVEDLITKMPAGDSSEPYRLDAQIELAAAYTAADQIEAAIRTADSLTDPARRAQAYARSAAAAESHAYGNLIDEAQSACADIREPRAAEAAWKSLAEIQRDLGDITGAEKTAALAGELGGPAWQVLVSYYSRNGRFDEALRAAGHLSDDNFQFTRQKSIQGIIMEASAAGKTDIALSALNSLTQPHVRDLAVPPVARALVEAGEVEAAVRLVDAIKRTDAKESALSVVLFTHATQNRLPPPDLINKVPKRGGAGLCWAAAASAGEAANITEAWLTQLTQPVCRAFAYAGAAYAITSSPEPEAVFAQVDPTRTSERMAEAMQRGALFQR